MAGGNGQRTPRKEDPAHTDFHPASEHTPTLLHTFLHTHPLSHTHTHTYSVTHALELQQSIKAGRRTSSLHHLNSQLGLLSPVGSTKMHQVGTE